MKIALGAAKGLAFLHEAEKPVIYRDFKASNILLDSVSYHFHDSINLVLIQSADCFNHIMSWYSILILFFFSNFQDYSAKLSDFGLAKDGPEGDDTHVSTRVMGTQGYAAPEYVMTGKLIHIKFQPTFTNFLFIFK